MAVYNHQQLDIPQYIQSLYDRGLQTPKYISNPDVEELMLNIGIFKFKGYLYAFKNELHLWSIEDILMVCYFDRYLSKQLIDLSIKVEAKLKTILIEEAYKETSNPFFYLIESNYVLDPHINYVIQDFKINPQGWKNIVLTTGNQSETYKHYQEYYLHTYDFSSNRNQYLSGAQLIIPPGQVNTHNFPPFHYFVESAVLGNILEFTKRLNLNGTQLIKEISKRFGIYRYRNFVAYLDRTKEIRNRCAHNGRIFNRNYRSVVATENYKELRKSINVHRVIDVYMTLLFLSKRLEHQSYKKFKQETIERVFRGFKSDVESKRSSKMLVKKYKRKEYEKLQLFLTRAMGET